MLTGLLNVQRTVAEHINRATLGWVDDFRLGLVDPACAGGGAYATKLQRLWPYRQQRMRVVQHGCYPDECPWGDMGLTRLKVRTASHGRSKA